MDIPNSNAYRLAVNTVEAALSLRRHARPVEVVILHRDGSVSEDVACGNLREALRKQTRESRWETRRLAREPVFYGDVHPVSGCSRSRSMSLAASKRRTDEAAVFWMDLEIYTKFERKLRSFNSDNSWKRHRRVQRRAVSVSCRPWMKRWAEICMLSAY